MSPNPTEMLQAHLTTTMVGGVLAGFTTLERVLDTYLEFEEDQMVPGARDWLLKLRDHLNDDPLAEKFQEVLDRVAAVVRQLDAAGGQPVGGPEKIDK